MMQTEKIASAVKEYAGVCINAHHKEMVTAAFVAGWYTCIDQDEYKQLEADALKWREFIEIWGMKQEKKKTDQT